MKCSLKELGKIPVLGSKAFQKDFYLLGPSPEFFNGFVSSNVFVLQDKFPLILVSNDC